jgi:NADPH:quinone reductase-like Zn-dependent oxidoreductase
LSVKPQAVSHEDAAAIALVGCTAYEAIFDVMKASVGDRILILGGSSAVGSVAIQMAKAKGLWVATTCSTRNLCYVKQFNPDLIIDYTTQKWEDHSELVGIYGLFDTVGERGAFTRSTQGVLDKEGYFLSIANFDPITHPTLKFAGFFCLRNDPKVQDILAEMLSSGTLKVTIQNEFPFSKEGLVAMYEKIAGGKSQGKHILRIC